MNPSDCSGFFMVSFLNDSYNINILKYNIMRRSKFSMPEINTGSMADISFLLLIFFLVTAVIPNDQGFNRLLPEECPPGQDCNAIIKEHNLLLVRLNEAGEIMVNEAVISLEELKDITIEFIDNNREQTCSYCQGAGLDTLSDHPTKAVISPQTHPLSKYERFIEVQDELTKAYYFLRRRYIKTVLNKDETSLTKEEMKEVKSAYPFILSEAETNQL